MKAATFKVRKADNDVLFQSTPPVKAATSGRGIVEWDAVISIHAAREGGDFARKVYDYRMRFQSTPPVKAATLLCRGCHDRQSISIHAAREGGDKNGNCYDGKSPNFNPRRP